MRWVAFFGVVASLLLLTSGRAEIQWIGWFLSCITCLAWAYFAKKDGDIPRMLMELFYFIASAWGVHNWLA
tara:strand:+ start:202 stop:414 length:213 start_codon:yes stop_codon:yes gene_type:complete